MKIAYAQRLEFGGGERIDQRSRCRYGYVCYTFITGQKKKQEERGQGGGDELMDATQQEKDPRS